MTAIQNIEVKRGDTRRHIFVIKDQDGVAVPISTWTLFALSIHSVKDPVDATTELESIAGVLTTDGADGRVSFIPSGTLPKGTYYYDAQALDDNSDKFTFVEGEYSVDQDRSKA